MINFALIGPTASGKSDIALNLAQEYNCNIFSIDSLSIYKQIDIASAKPLPQELQRIRHFGINELSPNEAFNVTDLFTWYEKAYSLSKEQNKGLIITGGTSFYLKTLVEGISPLPIISDGVKQHASQLLENLSQTHAMLLAQDPKRMQNIDPNDRYRIEKMLHLYLQTGMTPSAWFDAHPPQPVIDSIKIFSIEIERDLLRHRIRERTHTMIKEGLIDEVRTLQNTYGDSLQSRKAIGIKEVISYFNEEYSKEQMIEKIITNTNALAKRQRTFNAHQFKEVEHHSKNSIRETIIRYITKS